MEQKIQRILDLKPQKSKLQLFTD